ncbi:MAG: hypothetical protein ACPG32_03475 [Akkermansiaceae bacterium]
MLIRVFTLFTLLIGLCSGEVRRFQNADETKSFFGELVDYDAKKKLVTVKLQKGNKKIKFALNILSEDDQKYVLNNADRVAVANNIEITLKKFSDKSKKELKPRIVNRVHPSGYTIQVNNRSKKVISNITLNYTLYYAVQDYLKPERKDETKEGSLTIEKIVAQRKQTHKTETIDIVSGKLDPVIKNVRRKGADGQDYIEPVVEKPGGKRKDLLQGCKVDVLVDGKVVKTITEGTLKVTADEE